MTEKNIIVRLLVIIFCTFFSTWQYVVLSLSECTDCLQRMDEIANGLSIAPFAFRILTPKIIVGMGNTIEAIILFQAIMFVLFYTLLWAWAARLRLSPLWVLPTFAMIIAAMMPTYYYSLYTLPEWNFLLCTLLLLPRWSQPVGEISIMRFAFIIGLVIIGTLNREMTGALIWLLVFAAYPKRWQWWLPLGIVVAIINIALRVLISAKSVYSIAYVWQMNQGSYRIELLILHGILIIPMILLFLWFGFRARGQQRLMIAVVLVPYFILVILLGSWSEVRLWMPLFIVGLPLIKLNR